MLGLFERPVGTTAELAIQAQDAEVRRASNWLGQTGDQLGVPTDQIVRLDLCLNEALANIISHGGPLAAAAPVRLRIEHTRCGSGNEAALTVSDAGPAFDPTCAAPKLRPATLAEAEPGGLGLTMMKNFSDALTYCHTDGHNQLTFTVRWNRE